MKHFICLGECKGESEEVGVCQSDECSLKGVVLVECECEDGLHQQTREHYKQAQKQNIDVSQDA